MSKKKIYLAPIADFPVSDTQALVQYCQKELKLPVVTLPPAPLYATLLDRKRQQFVAEKLIGLVQRQNPILAEAPRAIIIGLTRYDIFPRGDNLRYVFGMREGGRFGVISTARMESGQLWENGLTTTAANATAEDADKGHRNALL